MAFAVVYLVNGHDFLRAAIAGLIWLAIGWYSGKVLYPSRVHQADSSVNSHGGGDGAEN